MKDHFYKNLFSSLFIFGIITVSTFIALLSTNLFFIQLGWRPNEFIMQIIIFIFTLTMIAFLSSWVSPMTKRFKHSEYSDILDPINKALQQLAAGDFDINLDVGFFENSPVGDIINDINFAATELSKLETMRQEFISNVSHEIQSPLTSINGFAKALKEFELTEEERYRYLCIIEEESDRLSKISANLLKLSALESEQQKVEPITYALDKQLVQCVLSCEPRWLEKNIEMDIHLDKISIHADKDLMSQVWINLISNSIKFTPPNGIIRIHGTIQEPFVFIKIEDNGIGLSQEEQNRIFERFYKADKSRTATKGGSGLGLSIVKKIIELHHGEITVASIAQKGTTFTIKLPLN